MPILHGIAHRLEKQASDRLIIKQVPKQLREQLKRRQRN